MSKFMGVIITILKIIFLLGFLILIHEGGHFLVAKLCKIKVNEFAIGFGPKVWEKERKETKYTLRLIPLGGFVNIIFGLAVYYIIAVTNGVFYNNVVDYTIDDYGAQIAGILAGDEIF